MLPLPILFAALCWTQSFLNYSYYILASKWNLPVMRVPVIICCYPLRNMGLFK